MLQCRRYRPPPTSLTTRLSPRKFASRTPSIDWHRNECGIVVLSVRRASRGGWWICLLTTRLYEGPFAGYACASPKAAHVGCMHRQSVRRCALATASPSGGFALARLIVYLSAFVIAVAVMFSSAPDGPWFAVSSGVAVGFLIPILDTLVLNGRFLRMACYSLRTWRTRVRISVSYLYRIKVDNEFLLVKGQRFEQYQPVGGVYKAHPSSSGVRREMNVLDDNLLSPDAVSEGDLRVRVPGRKLLAFLRWFERGQGRELDGWREFYEELIATGILPEDTFRFIKYDFVRRIYRPMRYSQWAQGQEILIADILELLPTPEQDRALRELKGHSDPRILWATERQIRRLGATDGAASQTTQIARTAEWTIDPPV